MATPRVITLRPRSVQTTHSDSNNGSVRRRPTRSFVAPCTVLLPRGSDASTPEEVPGVTRIRDEVAGRDAPHGPRHGRLPMDRAARGLARLGLRHLRRAPV